MKKRAAPWYSNGFHWIDSDKFNTNFSPEQRRLLKGIKGVTDKTIGDLEHIIKTHRELREIDKRESHPLAAELEQELSEITKTAQKLFELLSDRTSCAEVLLKTEHFCDTQRADWYEYIEKLATDIQDISIYSIRASKEIEFKEGNKPNKRLYTLVSYIGRLVETVGIPYTSTEGGPFVSILEICLEAAGEPNLDTPAIIKKAKKQESQLAEKWRVETPDS